MINTIGTLRRMAKRLQELGGKPELEVFEFGHLMIANDLIKEGLIDGPSMLQLCMGVGYGVPDELELDGPRAPASAAGHLFSLRVGPMQLPYAAMAPLAGANVRIGLEDSRRLATNDELVQWATEVLDRIGGRVIRADEMRKKLRLKSHD